ncbi:Rab13 [Giardia muris]|uniref:Rab13 n=1 Tax=Giardia muris TaxID=5742 RepID=A0A4Z1SX66_GIAMU|nr:Rab13 [Giardia muris]|eukprot:TNJ26303.1 Rab13 [Giardia muris]
MRAKVILVGDSRVGKTALLHRMHHGLFTEKTEANVGIDWATICREVDGQDIQLAIWDTAGAERFRSLTTQYVRDASVVLVVFSLSDRVSFQSVGFWRKTVAKMSTGAQTAFLVGTKADLTETRVISQADAIRLSELLDFSRYVEISSRTGEGVEDLIQMVALEAIEHSRARVETLTVSLSASAASQRPTQRSSSGMGWRCC